VTLRVLVAAPESEFAQFLRDVLTELEGSRHWGSWVHLDVLYKTTWSETAEALAGGEIDALLLDADLRDRCGVETFRRAQAIAPHVPVILLAASAGAALAERMIRDGAQDFLLKDEVDCAPLARAIRNAVERHRLLTAARATAMTDSLTGLLTGPAFLTLADRDRLLAEQLNRRLMILIAEPAASQGAAEDVRILDAQRRDLALVEAADQLRTVTGPTGLLARLDDSQFGLALWDTDVESLEEIRARLAALPAGGSLRFGAAVFDPRTPVPLESLLEQAAADLRPAPAR